MNVWVDPDGAESMFALAQRLRMKAPHAVWGFYLKDAVAYPGGPVVGVDMVSIDGASEALARAFGFEGIFDEEDGLQVGDATPYGEEWGLPGEEPTPFELEVLER